MELDHEQDYDNSNDNSEFLNTNKNAQRLNKTDISSIVAQTSSSGSQNEPENEQDICRVCRSEATSDRPLFYPCVCTGSIKYIHQECLVQWLKYSKKEYCELCKHKFSFAPIYHPDMPKRLPIKDIITGLLKNIFKAMKFWLHSTLVALSWLAIVPLTACRIYRCLFAGSVSSLLTLPLDMLSTENIISDILQGGFVVLCSLAAFISLVWLREQILSGGGPEWLENIGRQQQNNQNVNNNNAQNINNVNNQEEMGEDPAIILDRFRQENVQPLLNQLINNDNEERLNNEANNIFQFDDDPIEDEENNIEEIADEIFNEDILFDNQPPNENNENNNNGQGEGQQAAANDDNHWNPMEWDRAAEDLTWDRLLGLDGSLLFLEHVFWVISLNTLFILVFAFCPYHLGHYMIYGMKLQEYVDKTHFEGLITTLVGYMLLALMLIAIYISMAISSFHRARKVIGLCYIVIKVALLVVIEICIFPLVCGFWLDACSLKLFNATLNDRMTSFDNSPGTSVFIHWLIGMIYVFYFATFVFLLREVLRPGILWFLRNLNDPDFNPVQEMIQLSVLKHIRRFLTSITLFGFSIVLLLLLPIKIVTYLSSKTSWPTLPYNVSQNSEALASELSVELLWLHVVLPAILEQSHMRAWAKNMVRFWALCISWFLDIKSFLLGDTEQKTNNNGNNNENVQVQNNGVVQGQGLQNPFQFNIGIAHQALLQHNTPFVNEPFAKPSYFKIRICAFIVMICISLLISSIGVIVIPVSIGRVILYKFTGNFKLNEFYTVIVGLYSIWLTIRFSIMIYNWCQIGLFQIFLRFKRRFLTVFKSSIAIFMIFGVLPLPFGLLFQQVIINPLSCNHDQTPVISIWQIWALGVLLAKILTALVLTGPQWWLREAIDTICQNGFRNIDLKFIFLRLFYPVLICIGLALTIPCILSRSGAPLITQNEINLILIERRIYPISLFLFSFILLFFLQIRQFKRLYERIRNDKYLVGQRLINFERQNKSSQPKTSSESATSK